MKVLMIGGTGVISSACSQLAEERGMQVTLLNRGTSVRPAPAHARILLADVRDPSAVRNAVGGLKFDAVVDFLAYEPAHIEQDIDIFGGRTGQFMFISTAAAYQKPPAMLPVTESTLLDNPFWDYARLKIACEERLWQAYRTGKLPITIVRPSHTYDQTKIPLYGGYTMIDRMRRGKPAIAAGDGTSVWVLTHHRDFAVGLVGLLGNSHALGAAFHITSDELLTWNQIYRTMADAAGVEANIIHLPSDIIARHDAQWGPSLLGDKAHSMIFDNTRIRHAVPDFNPATPFSIGSREIMAWYDADPARQVINPIIDRSLDQLAEVYRRM
jgi:nucleoside-diphosphate-sugar epimerase